MSYISSAQAGDWALHILGRPRAGRYTSTDAEFLAQADAKHIYTFKGLNVVVHEWNAEADKTVLLLHGWESNAARWQPLIELLLEGNYHIVAPDAPAHGGSDGNQFNMLVYAELIRELVERWQPYSMVGHSLGGSASCLYLHRLYLAQAGLPSLERLVIMGVPSELKNMVTYFGDILGLSPRMRRTIERRFQERYELTYEALSVATFCESVTVPTLVIHDEQDALASAEDARRYDQALADSELFITNGLGHSLQGAAVYERILEYLEKEMPLAL